MITKNMERALKKWGYYDTKKYHYRAHYNIEAQRIEIYQLSREYLGYTAMLDAENWKVVGELK